MSTVGAEKGVTTGRARRCGWFDAAALKRSIQINGVSGLCVTKLDVMDGMETIQLCVGYEMNGVRYDILPFLVFDWSLGSITKINIVIKYIK
jgi:adenylosuccinate synthase